MSDVLVSAHQHEGCQACRLCVADNTWRPSPDFNYSPKFLFVCDQFVPGLAGRLRKLLRSCDFDASDIEVAYLSRCWAGENRKAQIREGQRCKPLFDDLLAKVSPETIIVPMGATPCKVIAKQKSIQTAHGTVVHIDGRIFVPTLHPAQVVAYPDSLPNFVADLGKIADAGEGKFIEAAKTKYVLVDTMDKFKSMLKSLWESKVVAFDIETSTLSPFRTGKYKPTVLCFSFSNETHKGWCLPIDHSESPWTEKERRVILKYVKQLLENPEILFVAHNGQFDTKYIRKVLGIEVANFGFDTLLAHFIAVSEEKGTHGLKILAWEFTDMGGYDDPLEEYKAEHPEADVDKGGSYANIPLDILWKYAAADTDCTLRLYEVFQPKVEEGFRDLFYNIVMPATRALADVEFNGAPIDLEWWKHCNTEYPRLLQETLDRLREFPEVLEVERRLRVKARKTKERERLKRFKDRSEKIHQMEDSVKAERALARLKADIAKAKEKPIVVPPATFNPGSPDQKAMLLFDVLGFSHGKKTKAGGRSTDKEVLKELYAETKHPIIQALGKYIKMATLNGMFVAPMMDIIGDDGRLRGGYHVFGTETGRLSMSEPNLQQIPKNVKEDAFIDVKLPSIKKMFYAPEGYVILQFDYSQAELRVLAALSRDPTLLDAYEKGEDVHRRVAAEAWEITQEEVTDQQRHAAKTINFGLIYGQGAKKLAKTIGFSEEEAKDFISIYFKKLPKVKKWIAKMKAHVREHGEIRSPYGRVRRLATAFSPEKDIVAKAERQGVNSPIQATASDCTLQSIARITAFLRNKGLESRIIVTVHDSIVLLVKIEEAVRVYKAVKKIMQNPPHDGWLEGVSMVADAEVGKSWGELTGVKSVDELQTYLAEILKK